MTNPPCREDDLNLRGMALFAELFIDTLAC